jgi:hypothetical protein
MRTISEALGGSVEGITYTAKDGRTHEVRPLTLERMSLFERYLESRAFEAVQSRRELLGDSYSEALSSVTQDIVSGKYVFTGPVCMKAIDTLEGQVALLAILLGVDRIRAKKLMLEDPLGVKEAMSLMMKQSQTDSEGLVPSGNTEGEAK